MTVVNVVVFILILIVLIVLHELGHMLVAKACGMRVERFSVFFGKPLWSVKRGETEYGIGWLPLGGYVKITGMTREELVDREYDDAGVLVRETPVPPEVASRAYCNSTTPRKIATIFAGPAANVVVAVIAFALSFWVGIARFDSSPRLASVAPDKAAATAGLERGDVIVSVNGVGVGEDPATGAANLDALTAEIQRNVGKPVTLQYRRDGTVTTVTTIPLTADPADASKGRLGVGFDQVRTGTLRYGPVDGVVRAIRFTGFLTREQVFALGKLFTDQQTREQVQGPIGIGATYNEFAEEGLGTIFRFVGIISLILAIMNLIPLLPLDGGHIVFALAERIRRRPLGIQAYQRASIVGIAVVLVLAIYAFNNDIGRITGEGFRP